jgi:hypothetical protein
MGYKQLETYTEAIKLVSYRVEKEGQRIGELTSYTTYKPEQKEDALFRLWNQLNLTYHSDWNWLMEVVEKIESLEKPITNNPNLVGKNEDYEVHIQGKHVKIYAHGEVTKEVVDLRSSESNSKIEAVYNACIEFIKWYNENNPIN